LQVDVSGLPEGIYFLSLLSAEGMTVKKIALKR
jgi:hypothetical protein